MVQILEDAEGLRETRRQGDPERSPDETTEDDVVRAMLDQKMSSSDVLSKKDRLTELLRKIAPKS